MADEVTVDEALAEVAAGRWDTAEAVARRASVARPESQLARALASYLGGLSSPGVYDEPSAFETFIDNGGNVALYRQTIQRLSTIHAEVQPRAVLDIGCGDGRVTAGSLTASTSRIDLVEPSGELLAKAIDALARPGLDVVAHRMDVATFLGGSDDDTTWDIAQSTFALHATAPAQRPALLRSLARRAQRLVIVEFDVPRFADRSPDHIAYLAIRYEEGVRQYEQHPDVVARFLLPVLVGQLDPTRARYTFEQPIAEWARLLHDAGFTTSVQPIDSYWWADAMLISAISHAADKQS